MSLPPFHDLYVAVLGPILDALPPDLANLIFVAIHGGNGG